MKDTKNITNFNSKRKKQERGITLIALVITIIILIILATVTITLVFGEGGLIQRAQEGKELTEQAGQDEQDELKGAEEFINGVLAGIGTTNPPEEEPSTPPEPEIPETTQEAKPDPSEDGLKFEDTTTIKDDLENEVTIPGGFHLDKDSGTKVEEGIVIEDDNGNQFVWIPVGEYNVSTTINSTGKLMNELTRRNFTIDSSIPVANDNVIDGYYYGEENNNSVAKDQIDAFKTSSIENKGFYIGRYEQGEGNICQAGINPYIELTRNAAKTQAETMYKENEFITSELISSYAWDTTLNFICQTNAEGYLLATTADEKYANIGTAISTNNRKKTGEYEADNYSNIHDFLGNCFEWTTEYSTNNKGQCVTRGYYDSTVYAACRGSYSTSFNSSVYGFRVQLYIINN